MKEKMSLDLKRILVGLLEKDENIVKKIIRSAPTVTAWEKDGKITSRTAQVMLNGGCSFRLPYNTEAEKELVLKMVPGRILLLSVGAINVGMGKQQVAQSQSGEVKAPAKFTNYSDVEILFIGKGEGIEVDTDLEEAELENLAEVTEVIRESTGFGTTPKGGGDIPVMTGEDLQARETEVI